MPHHVDPPIPRLVVHRHDRPTQFLIQLSRLLRLLGDLYRKLRTIILPMFYKDRDRWTEVMRHAIAFNASFFNTHRMVQQYAANAYV